MTEKNDFNVKENIILHDIKQIYRSNEFLEILIFGFTEIFLKKIFLYNQEKKPINMFIFGEIF